MLAESIDFERLRRLPIKLFVTATNVRTGRGRVFRNAEITPTCCSPPPACRRMFQAVEIDGEPYWDGGFRQSDHHPAGARMQVARHDPGADQPGRAPGTPRSARDILDRLNEISFNAVR